MCAPVECNCLFKYIYLLIYVSIYTYKFLHIYFTEMMAQQTL